MKPLQKVDKILNYSGITLKTGLIPPLRKGYYRVLDQPVSGDAPKNFIQIYQYGFGRKSSPKTWPKYIAKIGHKWYPVESITEHLLNRLGDVFNIRTAYSQLRMVHGQLRFLSRYFLKANQILTHGAEIYSAYLEEDGAEFIDQIEEAKLSRSWITFQFTIQAIQHTFAQKSGPIVADFVKMLVFDAIVGNNDRHFYNWGVIEDVHHLHDPLFSPVYDTARGLFWNEDEAALERKYLELGNFKLTAIHKYAEKSMPKLGWEGEYEVTHFQLISNICGLGPHYHEICKSVILSVELTNVESFLHTEFEHLISPLRLALIKVCLDYRVNRLKEIFLATQI